MNYKINKRIYDYPIHFQKYYVGTDEIYLSFINANSRFVEKITVKFNEEILNLNVNSNYEDITLEIKDFQKSNIAIVPELVSCVIDGKAYPFNKKINSEIIGTPKSIYSLGNDRYLYKERVSKALDYDKKGIKYLGQDYKNYWHCVCGYTNVQGVEKCGQCGIEKEKLFNVKLDYEEISRDDNVLKSIFVNTLIWIFIGFMIQLFVQLLGGDFIYENDLKNTFFGIFNRIITPFALMITVALLIRTTQIHNKQWSNILKIVFAALVLYLNILPIFWFIKTSYSYLFLLMLNTIMIVGLIVSYKKSILKNVHYLFSGILTLTLILGLINYGKYSIYDLTINGQGISLNVVVDEDVVDYYIPATIENNKVYAANFIQKANIKTLGISDNLTKITFKSTATFPILEEVIVDKNNKQFYMKNDVLYENTGMIKLVPIDAKEIYIDDPTIPARALLDNINLEKVVIGPNVKIIKNNAFENASSLKKVIFEDNSNLEIIEDKAFLNCVSLKEISFPISLEYLGLGVLEGTSSLEKLSSPFIGARRENYDDLSKNIDILPYFFGSRTYLESSIIPANLTTVEFYDIDRIHNVTFYGATSLKEIILPNNLISMGIQSFYNCEGLTSFIVPNGVEVLKRGVFENNTNLREITIPASVKVIEEDAFLNCDSLVVVNYLGDINDLVINAEGNEAILNILRD